MWKRKSNLDQAEKKRLGKIHAEMEDLGRELFNILDPEYVSKISDTELDGLRGTVRILWRERGSKEEDDSAISASIVISNEYKLRGRLPKKDKLDEILERIDSSKYVDERVSIKTLVHTMIADKLVGEKTDISGYSKNEIDRAEEYLSDYYRWEKRPEIKKKHEKEQKIDNEDYLSGVNAGIERLKEERKRRIAS